mgnify:CR=1 FL=1
MNTELLERIMIAKEYQKKAVYALFPEEMSGHLEVIEREVRMMAAEFVKAMAQNEKSGAEVNERNERTCTDGQGKHSGRPNGARKIDIT